MSKKSFELAFSGIASALCIALEFSVGIMPLFLYVFTMASALIMSIIMIECGPKLALCSYLSVAVLSLALVPDKEACLMFSCFFGYYPIARKYLVRIRPRLISGILRLAVFNISVTCSYLILIRLVGLEAAGFSSGGAWYIALLYILGNAAFVDFDILLGRLTAIYSQKYRGRFFGRRKK